MLRGLLRQLNNKAAGIKGLTRADSLMNIFSTYDEMLQLLMADLHANNTALAADTSVELLDSFPSS